jgi:hypothetical protein
MELLLQQPLSWFSSMYLHNVLGCVHLVGTCPEQPLLAATRTGADLKRHSRLGKSPAARRKSGREPDQLLIALSCSSFTKCSRAPFARQWDLLLAFVMGLHPTRRAMSTPPPSKWAAVPPRPPFGTSKSLLAYRRFRWFDLFAEGGCCTVTPKAPASSEPTNECPGLSRTSPVELRGKAPRGGVAQRVRPNRHCRSSQNSSIPLRTPSLNQGGSLPILASPASSERPSLLLRPISVSKESHGESECKSYHARSRTNILQLRKGSPANTG